MMEKDPKRRLLPELEIPTHPYFEGVDWQLMEERRVPPPWLPTEEVSQGSKSYITMPTPGEFFSNESDPYPEFHFLSVEAQRAIHDGFQGPPKSKPAPLIAPLPPLEIIPPPHETEIEPLDAADDVSDETDLEDITSVLSDPASPPSPCTIPSNIPSISLEPGPSTSQKPDEPSTGYTVNNDDTPVGLWSKLRFILHKIKIPKLRGWRTRLP
ncbi:hypothetical protein CPB83DRAFT_517764 [Crepidotus variabilis]|uniref:AGC-kinase C-terminal domain-containing protein n=1 Tax=Crepidotus variabilis TaxID=179855 RepID=A0A9P6EB32_9AGAR|nr:hypothetical protein CPB83DRAFT_517764 [Crepidotus variabilis]